MTLVLGADRPAGLMQGYQGDDGKLSGAEGALYRSGDVVFADDEGYLTFVGRSDDVFKSSDYRISPFELESVLLEHDSVAEAAVVPSPDPIRLAIPKAYVLLTAGTERSSDTALSIFKHHALHRSSVSENSNWSPNCRRRSREKSAACNCAGWSMTTTATIPCAGRNIARMNSRTAEGADRRAGELKNE